MLSLPLSMRDSHRLVVDESRIPDRLWHRVDLERLQGRLRSDGVAASPVSASLAGFDLGRTADRKSAGGEEASVPIVARKRLVRVPDSAFVVIGRSVQASANDNQAPRPSSARIRFALRDALMLAPLAASLAGAFYTGRQHATQNVIVVPVSSNSRNAVT